MFTVNSLKSYPKATSIFKGVLARSFYWIFFLLPVTACSAADCDTLVTETRSACIDMISRGLDVSCNTYLGAVDMAMEQAGGDLFDVGEANQKTADSFCATYVKKLRAERMEKDASMHAKDESDAQCVALAERFDTNCMADFGKTSLPGECKNVARTFVMANTKQMSQKQVCTIAGMQLP